jgi:hypothetical protein
MSKVRASPLNIGMPKRGSIAFPTSSQSWSTRKWMSSWQALCNVEGTLSTRGKTQQCHFNRREKSFLDPSLDPSHSLRMTGLGPSPWRPLRPFGVAAMWMSSHEHTSPLFSSASLCSPTKERLAAMRGTAPGRHTDLKCAPLKAQSPGISVSRIEPSGVFSPGSQRRRVVPWGDVSSWVKGAE